MNEATRKVAVITGASQGIGAGLVAAYRRLGYAVVATSRSIGASTDPEVLTVRGDIADPATAERLISEGLGQFGRIDTLVNNAGLYVGKPFTDYTLEDYQAVVGVNLTGMFALTQRAITAMLRTGGGHVVNITTSLVTHANSKAPSVLAALTKGGVDAATRSLAIEYARQGIRVNAVSPGIINTPMHAHQDPRVLGEMHPLGRMGEVSDIVGAVLYLEGAPFVTGETLHVDGGQAAGS
jgi:NAD(P)-dependent dehydrogenase (short-subunit alcohol dehydrogenase family)